MSAILILPLIYLHEFICYLLILVRQSLVIKLVVTLNYNLTQYFFIRGEFRQIHHWMTFSSYIFHACKIFRKLKINSYIINKFFKLQVFVV